MNKELSTRKRKPRVVKFSCHIDTVDPQIDLSMYVGEVDVVSRNSNGEQVVDDNREETVKKPEHNGSDYSGKYKELSKTYLLNAFPFLVEEFVDEQLKNHNYSVIDTFEYLKGNLYFESEKTTIEGKDVPLLDKNRDIIKIKPESDPMFLEDVLYLEKKEQKDLKEKQIFFMNSVLIDSAEYFKEKVYECCGCGEVKLSKDIILPSCNNSNHGLCKRCFLKKFNHWALTDSVSFHCQLAEECKGSYSFDQIRSNISSERFNSFLSSLRQRTMTTLVKSKILTEYKQCQRCGEYSPLKSGNEEMFMCRNSKCGFVFCRKCGGEMHWGQECPVALLEQEFVNYVSQAMDTARSTKCPWCGLLCSKISACNHIKCPKCSKHFCYLCGKGIAETDKAFNYNHWWVEKICPLQCETKSAEQQQRDEERARVAGQKAADEWRNNHPDHKDFKLPEIFGIK